MFDRLYEDWSTLDKFQRTRGVLQYMAIVIHRLWDSRDKDPLIMPGSLPLDDALVRNKSIHYLPNGWEPVIEREMDGPRSAAADIDGHDTRFGSLQAARRVARTIFLGSAPSNAAQAVRGIRVDGILLGAVQPGQAVGTYEDVIKRLRDRLHYLYGEKDSYWFDTRPNLRREMESRKANLKDADDVMPLLRDRVGRVFTKGNHFAAIHVFVPSADVPDEFGLGPRLVVLPPNAGYRKQDESLALLAATEVLEKRGDAPRLKRNRLIFLAPDGDAVQRLRDAVRTYLAWKSIVEDVQNRRIDLGTYQADQAKRAMDGAEDGVKQMVRETYRWLMVPTEEMVRGKLALRWEAVALSASAPSVVDAIESKLKEEEWLVSAWSPVHLNRMLNQWYFKEGVTEVSALKVWQDSCQYLFCAPAPPPAPPPPPPGPPPPPPPLSPHRRAGLAQGWTKPSAPRQRRRCCGQCRGGGPWRLAVDGGPLAQPGVPIPRTDPGRRRLSHCFFAVGSPRRRLDFPHRAGRDPPAGVGGVRWDPPAPALSAFRAVAAASGSRSRLRGGPPRPAPAPGSRAGRCG